MTLTNSSHQILVRFLGAYANEKNFYIGMISNRLI
jgi:hypothetical protein